MTTTVTTLPTLAHRVYVAELLDGTGRVQICGAVSHVTLRTCPAGEVGRICRENGWTRVNEPWDARV